MIEKLKFIAFIAILILIIIAFYIGVVYVSIFGKFLEAKSMLSLLSQEML